mmetsp:Transcript_11475/g.32546  ORF Transcript_11475/g.32546 Transcript_11475/m.32546 type:complete len:189 (-) Transcript_11475:1006-1572(-)
MRIAQHVVNAQTRSESRKTKKKAGQSRGPQKSLYTIRKRQHNGPLSADGVLSNFLVASAGSPPMGGRKQTLVGPFLGMRPPCYNGTVCRATPWQQRKSPTYISPSCDTVEEHIFILSARSSSKRVPMGWPVTASINVGSKPFPLAINVGVPFFAVVRAQSIFDWRLWQICLPQVEQDKSSIDLCSSGQ